MDTKKLIIGTVVGAVVLYGLGELIWSVLFANFFDANVGGATGVERESPILWAAILGGVFYALLINIGLGMKQGSATLANGIIVGAVVGACIWGTSDFIFYGYRDLANLTATIADTVLEGARGGITGAIVATVLGFVGGKTASASA